MNRSPRGEQAAFILPRHRRCAYRRRPKGRAGRSNYRHLRGWRWNQALRAQIQAAAADLEHLQLACSRLAPAGVVQQIVADGTRDGAVAAVEHKIATALFVDLVGFTELNDGCSPRSWCASSTATISA